MIEAVLDVHVLGHGVALSVRPSTIAALAFFLVPCLLLSRALTSSLNRVQAID